MAYAFMSNKSESESESEIVYCWRLLLRLQAVAGIGATVELIILLQFLSATNRITKVQNP